MVELDLFRYAIDDLLQRLNVGRQLDVVIGKGLYCDIHNFSDGILSDFQFFQALRRKLYLLIAYLSCCTYQIDGMPARRPELRKISL